MSAAETQAFAFIFSALLASESLLVSVFGSLYAVYGRYMTTADAQIVQTLRLLCYTIAFTVFLIAILNFYILFALQGGLLTVLPAFFIVLVSIIVIMISVPPLVISWRMYQDGAA